MSLAQIQEAIEELSAEEVRSLREWLSERSSDAADDTSYDQEGIRIAQNRLEELLSGKVKGLTQEEFWAGLQDSKSKLQAEA